MNEYDVIFCTSPAVSHHRQKCIHAFAGVNRIQYEGLKAARQLYGFDGLVARNAIGRAGMTGDDFHPPIREWNLQLPGCCFFGTNHIRTHPFVFGTLVTADSTCPVKTKGRDDNEPCLIKYPLCVSKNLLDKQAGNGQLCATVDADYKLLQQKGHSARKEGSMIWRNRLIGFTLMVSLSIFLTIGPAETATAEPLAFTLDARSYRQMEAQAIADQLKKMGIKVEVRAWEKSVLRKEMKAKKRAAYLESWGSAYFDPFDLGVPKLTIGGRGNFSFYENPKVDENLKLGSSSTDDQARQKAYFTVQEAIHQDVPWVFGYTKAVIEACSAEVTGFSPSMDNRINLHDVGLKKGDAIIVGMNTNAFKSLDPAAYRGRETETLIRNIFDGLVTRTNDGKVVPELAEKWEILDPTTYLFTLRKGATFHNGDPVTADDVVFTFERVLVKGGLGGKSSPRKGLLGPLAKVEKQGANQVRFVLEKPFPTLFQALVHFQVVPKNYIKSVGDEAFAKKPVGAGPFTFVRGKLDSEVVLKRFDGYYGGSPDIAPVGPAKVKTVVFRTMPESSTRVAALLAGEVHIIQAVPADLIDKLKGSKRVNVLTAEGTRCYHIELNTAKPPFNDIRVRKAINHAIDWDSILKNIYRGYAQRLSTCFLPSGFGYNPELKPYKYDPELARKLFKEAGYEVK